MKNRMLGLLLLMLIGSSTAANAQIHYYDTKHEVGVTIGAGSNSQIFSGLNELTRILFTSTATAIFSGGTVIASEYSYGDEHYVPALSLEYYYHVSKVVGLGGFLAYNGMNRDMCLRVQYPSSGKVTEEKSGEASFHNISLIPTAKFDWLRKKYFGLYSKVGIGVTVMKESQKGEGNDKTDFSNTMVIPNCQLSFLGMEVGSPNIRAFAELAIGEQGILLAGLKYKF